MPNPPIPTKLKILSGNPGKRALPKDEPVPLEGEIVMPTWLSAGARRIFRAYQAVLEPIGLLTTADVRTLAILASTEDEYIQADKDIRKHGARLQVYTKDGSEWVRNPSVTMRSDAGKRLKGLLVEFGLSPSSRTRVATKPKVQEDDPFARFERQA